MSFLRNILPSFGMFSRSNDNDQDGPQGRARNQIEQVPNNTQPLPRPFAAPVTNTPSTPAMAAMQARANPAVAPPAVAPPSPVATMMPAMQVAAPKNPVSLPMMMPAMMSPTERAVRSSRAEQTAAQMGFLQAGGSKGAPLLSAADKQTMLQTGQMSQALPDAVESANRNALQAGRSAQLTERQRQDDAMLYGDPHLSMRETLANDTVQAAAGVNDAKGNYYNSKAATETVKQGTIPQTADANAARARGAAEASSATAALRKAQAGQVGVETPAQAAQRQVDEARAKQITNAPPPMDILDKRQQGAIDLEKTRQAGRKEIAGMKPEKPDPADVKAQKSEEESRKLKILFRNNSDPKSRADIVRKYLVLGLQLPLDMDEWMNNDGAFLMNVPK